VERRVRFPTQVTRNQPWHRDPTSRQTRTKNHISLATTIPGQNNPDNLDHEDLSLTIRDGRSAAGARSGKLDWHLLEEASMDINTTVWYHIVNANSNRMLEVPGDGMTDDRLQNEVIIRQGDLYGPSDSSSWALWQFVLLGDGTYDILNKGSGRCLVIRNGETGTNVPGWQYKVNPQRPQEQWTITDVPNGNGNVYLQNANSTRYLEIDSSYTTKGAQCQQYDLTPPTRPGAQWQLMRTDLTTVPALTNARLDGNEIHHNQGVKTAGTMHGANLSIGSTVLIKKNNGARTWIGQIDGNHVSGLSIYWTFSVMHKSGKPDPDQDDTLNVTVTNTAQQTSPPVTPDPPASDVP
jgi:hypothetical protein